eukprot:Tbor_TRINITY_DN5797_c3_g3::TRINITY_DN5797_c3_g3_i1::g.20190::m.20190
MMDIKFGRSSYMQIEHSNIETIYTFTCKRDIKRTPNRHHFITAEPIKATSLALKSRKTKLEDNTNNIIYSKCGCPIVEKYVALLLNAIDEFNFIYVFIALDSISIEKFLTVYLYV